MPSVHRIMDQRSGYPSILVHCVQRSIINDTNDVFELKLSRKKLQYFDTSQVQHTHILIKTN